VDGGGDWWHRLSKMADGITGESPTLSRKRVTRAYKPSVKWRGYATAGGRDSAPVLGDGSVFGVARKYRVKEGTVEERLRLFKP
jgi:hypothetical protein